MVKNLLTYKKIKETETLAHRRQVRQTDNKDVTETLQTFFRGQETLENQGETLNFPRSEINAYVIIRMVLKEKST